MVYEYNDVVVNEINWHRGAIPLISGYVNIDISDLDGELRKDDVVNDFMEKYNLSSDDILGLFYYNKYDHSGYIISHSVIRFSMCYVEFLYPGCPYDNGLNIAIEYPQPIESNYDLTMNLRNIIPENEYEENLDYILKNVVTRIHKIVEDFIYNNTAPKIKDLVEIIMNEEG
ncbi:MAG: hypothetical protein QXD03_03120 [Candidatus Anstonellales archaeon]